MKLKLTKITTFLILVFSIFNISCTHSANNNTIEIDNNTSKDNENYIDVDKTFLYSRTWWFDDDYGTFTKGERFILEYNDDPFPLTHNNMYNNQGRYTWRDDDHIIEQGNFAYMDSYDDRGITEPWHALSCFNPNDDFIEYKIVFVEINVIDNQINLDFNLIKSKLDSIPVSNTIISDDIVLAGDKFGFEHNYRLLSYRPGTK